MRTRMARMPHCDAQYQLPDGHLNVWLPLTQAVARRPHCDAQYQLPDGHLKVWLPLTQAADTNSLYSGIRAWEGRFQTVERRLRRDGYVLRCLLHSLCGREHVGHYTGVS